MTKIEVPVLCKVWAWLKRHEAGTPDVRRLDPGIITPQQRRAYSVKYFLSFADKHSNVTK
jgi:hypothetical protein